MSKVIDGGLSYLKFNSLFDRVSVVNKILARPQMKQRKPINILTLYKFI